MIDHVSLGSSDLQRALDFYKACLEPLGYSVQHQDAGQAIFGANGKWQFALYPAQNGDALNGHRTHVAFSSPSEDATRAFHEAALERGAKTLRLPGLRPDINDQYFGTMITDPDQHVIEVVHWRA
jgi:catechol 2,3-dioxygenase-like lactoylglutathione lyase family enzyme